jgi:glycosyltransferase involved in cell wall biosynthesis
MKLTILILCLNESSTIAQAIDQAKQIHLDKEIIVIDNCSTDGTQELIKAFKPDPELKVVIHDKNMGVGYSVREGISIAEGDYLYAPGADLEYKMEDVYKMIEIIQNNNLDAVFGSRLLAKKGIPKFKLIKERPYWLGSMLTTSLINLFYGKKFTDIIATKLIKTGILKNLGCRADNPAFEFELVSRLCKQGYRIQEEPVWYAPRTHQKGKSIKAVHIIPALLAIFGVKLFVRRSKPENR